MIKTIKQIAILGLGFFGKSILDELLDLKVKVLIIDKDREVIDTYKDVSAQAVVVDILTVENLRKILPESTDAVIIDMGDKIEAAILATSYCAKLHIKIIVVKAETEALGEILELVGATKVVFPNKEAAKRVTPLLLSSALLMYLPVSRTLSIAELAIPVSVIGKTLIEAELRKKYHLNLISIRDPDEEFVSCAPDYRFKSGDIGLFSGSDEDLNHFVGFIPEQSAAAAEEPHTLRERFFNLFRKK